MFRAMNMIKDKLATFLNPKKRNYDDLVGGGESDDEFFSCDSRLGKRMRREEEEEVASSDVNVFPTPIGKEEDDDVMSSSEEVGHDFWEDGWDQEDQSGYRCDEPEEEGEEGQSRFQLNGEEDEEEVEDDHILSEEEEEEEDQSGYRCDEPQEEGVEGQSRYQLNGEEDEEEVEDDDISSEEEEEEEDQSGYRCGEPEEEEEEEEVEDRDEGQSRYQINGEEEEGRVLLVDEDEEEERPKACYLNIPSTGVCLIRTRTKREANLIHAQKREEAENAARSKSDGSEKSFAFRCKMCKGDKEASEWFRIKNCKHACCTQCAVAHVAASIEDYIVNIGCPYPSCSSGFLELECCRPILPAELFGKWEFLVDSTTS